MDSSVRNGNAECNKQPYNAVSSQKDKRIVSLDYVRVILTLCILTYHLADDYIDLFPALKSALTLLTRFANGAWGPPLVTMFFMLSGIGLYYKHSKIENVSQFYYKRWKSIIPLFLMVYLVFYILNFINNGHFMYKDPPQTILLTLTGMDGYSRLNTPISELLTWLVGGAPNGTYYLTGTWFLGPILIVYLLYPVILALFKRLDFLLLIIIAAIYFLEMQFTSYASHRVIFYCLTGFVMGMLFIKYIDRLKDWRLAVICLGVFLILYFVKLPSFVFYVQIVAACLLIAGYNLFEFVSSKVKKTNDIILKLSAISFTFFLYHIGTNTLVMMKLVPMLDIGFLEGWFFSVFVDLVLSIVTYTFYRWFIKTRLFLKFEERMLRIGTKHPIAVD